MNKKFLAASLMSIAMLTSIATGATYALFTAEDTVNVNVTAGKVSVTANVLPKFKVKSYNSELTEVEKEGTFAAGGKVTVEENGSITLDRIVPGDRVEFDVEIKNLSNIDVNYRSVVSVIEGLELFSALRITIDNSNFDGMTAYSKWEKLNPGQGDRTVKVTIELPEDTGDEFQGLTTKIAYTVNAIQGNSPVADQETDENVTYIYNANDFRLFAMNVNNGNTYKGSKVYLMENIDLENKEWTPIGNATNKFKGEFDGNNKTISNLNVGNKKMSDVGLFGYTEEGKIHNVHVHNADVEGRLNVGVVAGTPYTSVYENIKVTGEVEVDGFSYVGGVLGKNAYANVTNVTVDVEEGSYVNANSVENDIAYRTYVGGVIGFMGEGSHTVSNVTSNIDTNGSTCDVGGIVGIAHYGNTFVNCSSTGDVTIYDGEDSKYSLEIGGIAGVWHDGGDLVTFTNCTYGGELAVYSNDEANQKLDINFANGGLVGKAYGAGNGTLIIDGVKYTKSVQNLDTVLNEGGDICLGADVTVNANETAADSGYGVTGLKVNGGTFDGNGYELNVRGANSTWDCAVSITNGTIKNLTVSGAFRGIFMGGATGDVVIDNVIIDNVCYTFNSDDGNKDYSVTIKNSTLNGWTSFSDCHKLVTFENCNLGKGTGAYNYAFCRPYNATKFINCNFEEGYALDSTQSSSIVFENCYYNGQLITAENIVSLLGENAYKVTFNNK